MTAALIPSLSLTTTPAQPELTRAPMSPEVYRRRRLAVVAVVVGLVLGLASFGRQADATSTPEANAAQATVVVVQPGDTLWGIAQSLSPDVDPRPLVSALHDLAGGGALQPGQLLTIPRDLLD